MQDKPYALFGTCLGAIVAYEVAQRVAEQGLQPPVAFFPAAVSPPHLYAQAVAKLYLTGDSEDPLEEAMQKLRGWRDLPKETMMLVRLSPFLFPSNLHPLKITNTCPRIYLEVRMPFL